MLKIILYPALGAHFGCYMIQKVQDSEKSDEDELLSYAQLEAIEQCGSEN